MQEFKVMSPGVLLRNSCHSLFVFVGTKYETDHVCLIL